MLLVCPLGFARCILREENGVLNSRLTKLLRSRRLNIGLDHILRAYTLTGALSVNT